MATVAVLALLHWFTIVRVQGWATASTIFLASQTLIYVGSDVLAAPRHQPYVEYMGYAVILSFFVTQIAFAWLGLVPRHPLLRKSPTAPTRAMILLLLLSLAITLYYISRLNQNPILLGIENLVQGTENSVSRARLDAYATGDYLAPGFVNQFKNAIGPALGAITVGYLFRIKHPLRWPIAIVIVSILAIGLTVTAQRNPLFRVIVILLVYAALSRRRTFSPATIWAIVGGVVLFAFLSVIQGRNRADAGLIAGSLRQLWDRLFREQQSGGLIANDYVQTFPQPLYRSWILEFKRLLPGRSGESELAGQIANYSGSGGTVPETFLGSAQTALGTVGAMIFIAFFVFLIAVVTRKGLSGVDKAPLHLIGIAGVFVTLGGWAAGGPGSLFDDGLAAYTLLWWWGSRMTARINQSDQARNLGSKTRDSRPAIQSTA